MSETSRTQFAIRLAGATDEEIGRGIAAAQAIFDAAGVSAWDAAAARFQRDNYGAYLDKNGVIGPGWMTEEEDRISTLWDDAEEAAAQACCANWPEDERPVSVTLEFTAEALNSWRGSSLPLLPDEDDDGDEDGYEEISYSPSPSGPVAAA